MILKQRYKLESHKYHIEACYPEIGVWEFHCSSRTLKQAKQLIKDLKKKYDDVLTRVIDITKYE